MADQNRAQDHPLVRAMLADGHRFSFFQIIRLLQHAFPGRPPIGRQGPPSDELLRLRPTLDLAFASSDVRAVRLLPSEDGEPRFEVITTFLALYGAVSPLPTYFTEELLAQEEEGLTRAFLDIFHHRLLSLFYRAWEKYRYAATFRPDGSDALSRLFLALVGADRLAQGHRIDAVRLLGVAGLLARNPKSAGSVLAALSGIFPGVPFDVEPCVGRWVPIPGDQINRLAAANTSLGRDLSLGENVWDLAGTFRVSAGPLRFAEFRRFLPDGDLLEELREIVDLTNTDGLDFEVELRLDENEVPEPRLGTQDARLGWSAWLGRGPEMDCRVRFLMQGWRHGRN